MNSSMSLARSGILFGAALCASASAASEAEIQPPPIEDFSYALGYNLGNALKQRGVTPDEDEVMQGLRDALAGEEGRVPANQVATVLSDYYGIDRSREKAAQVARNKEMGERFLAQNAKRHGVKVLESGLQYEVLASGKGEKPGGDGVFVIHQLGKRLDGFVITDTRSRGGPDHYRLEQLLPGVAEAVAMMSVGDRWRLAIPPELGYGREGRPPIARGPVVLVWEVELLDSAPERSAEQN